MKIQLSKIKRKSGAIFFWLLCFIIVIVVAFIIVKIVACAKKVDKFKPKWDDVDAAMQAEKEYWQQQYPDAEVAAEIPEIYSLVNYYFITKTTNWIDWEFVMGTTNRSEFEAWQMPIDLNVPACFFNRQVVVTNQ